MKIRIAMLVVAGLAISALVTTARTAPVSDAAAAFARMKGLVGTWQGDSTMGTVQLTYELASGGHVLLEHSQSPQHDSMVTAYYLDGDKLVLTHYCELGNEPHMVARKIDLERGEIIFDFAGAGNLASPDAPHMHSATVRLLDRDHFTGSWTMFENQKPKMTVTSQFTRVQ